MLGPVTGVAAALELWEPKLAGWKRGREGSLKSAELVEECWRPGGGRRGACDGSARLSILLGENGDMGGLPVGMLILNLSLLLEFRLGMRSDMQAICMSEQVVEIEVGVGVVEAIC